MSLLRGRKSQKSAVACKINDSLLIYTMLKPFKKHGFYLCIAIILYCTSFACSNNVGRNLSESELVGEWIATRDSVEFLRSHDICCAGKEVKLTLSDAEKFELKNMSSCWTYDHKSCVSHTYDYEGTWSIANTESSNNLLLNEGTTHSLSLVKRSGEVQIVFWFGDPDNGKAIYLSKQ